MNLEEFDKSLSLTAPPSPLSIYLQALWYDRKGDWEKAHTLVQDIPGPVSAWIHAYLHRKEGDIGNASYWYHRAGKKISELSLAEEWESIAKELMDHPGN